VIRSVVYRPISDNSFAARPRVSRAGNRAPLTVSYGISASRSAWENLPTSATIITEHLRDSQPHRPALAKHAIPLNPLNHIERLRWNRVSETTIRVVYEHRRVAGYHIVRVGFSLPARRVTYRDMPLTWTFMDQHRVDPGGGPG